MAQELPKYVIPTQSYIWTNAQCQAFLDRYGSWLLYNGHMYDYQSRSLGHDRYEVTFKKRNYA